MYSYDYVVKLEMNEPAGLSDDQAPPPGSTVGYKIITKVEVKPVWQSETGGSILEILVRFYETESFYEVFIWS